MCLRTTSRPSSGTRPDPSRPTTRLAWHREAGAHRRAGPGGRGGADGPAARGRVDAARRDRAGIRRDRPARRRRTADGCCCWSGRATTAATRCTPERCWRGAAAPSRRGCCGPGARGAGWRRSRPPAAESWLPASAERTGRSAGRRRRRDRRHRRPARAAARRGRARSDALDGRPGRGRGHPVRGRRRHRRAGRPARRGRGDRHVRHPQDRPPGRPGGAACGAVHLVDIGLDLPHAAGRGAPARRRRAAAAPAGSRLPTSTPAASSASAPARTTTPAPRCSASPAPAAGWPGWCGTSATAGRDPVRAAHPEVVGDGRVQAWAVGSGGGDGAEEALRGRAGRRRPRRRRRRRARRTSTGPLRRPGGADPARRRARRAAPAPSASTSRRGRSRTPGPRPAVRRRRGAQGPTHARRATPTAGCASPRPASRGSPPPAPATSSPALIGSLLAAGLTPYDAASVGSWLHGAAATLAVGRRPAGRGRRGAAHPRGGPAGASAAERPAGWKNRRHESRRPRRDRRRPAPRSGTTSGCSASFGTGAQMMTVVKADGYGHGMVPVARAAREARRRVARRRHHRRGARAARRPATPGRMLCWLGVPGEDYAAAIAPTSTLTAYSVAELDEIARRGRGRRSSGAAAAQGRHRAVPRRRRVADWPAVVAAARDGRGGGDWPVTGIWSHFACSDEPDHPANDAQETAFREALAVADGRRAAARGPPPRQLGGRHPAPVRPLRPGPLRHRVVRPRPGARRTRRTSGCVPGDDRPGTRSRWSSRSTPATASPTATPGPPTATTTRRPGPGRVRRRRAAPRRQPAPRSLVGGERRPSAAGSAWTSSWSTSTATCRAPGADVVLFGAGRTGEPTAQDWAEACGTISYEIVTRIGGRLARRVRRRRSTPMSIKGKIARRRRAGAVGVAAAGTAVGVARRRRVIARRGAGDAHPVRVAALRPDHRGRRRRRTAARRGRRVADPDRGRRRTAACRAAADRRLRATATRSTSTAGTSSAPATAAWCGRSSTTSAPTAAPAAPTDGHATIDQLGRDLQAGASTHVAPDGPVVLVGHSMGGMSIVALAEQYPELFGDRVVGVGLISTTAGGLDPHRILVPMLPPASAASSRPRRSPPSPAATAPSTALRRLGKAVATVATDQFAFGDDGAGELRRVRRRDALGDAVRGGRGVLPELRLARQVRRPSRRSARCPTSIICGTDDKLTSIGHSRKLHDADPRLPAARVRGRRPHGDPRAARPGQRRARPAARRARRQRVDRR